MDDRREGTGGGTEHDVVHDQSEANRPLVRTECDRRLFSERQRLVLILGRVKRPIVEQLALGDLVLVGRIVTMDEPPVTDIGQNVAYRHGHLRLGRWATSRS